VQEEELDSCRATGERRPAAGMRVRGETQEGSPCAIFELEKMKGRQVRRPLTEAD
jgi:hypothetical protein